MRLFSLLSVMLLAGSAIPAGAQDRAAQRAAAGEEALSRITAGRTSDRPVDCINLRNIRSSEIVEDTAIVYRMNNGTLMVNRPAGGGILDRDDILVTRSIGTQLCRIDLVNLVDRNSRMFRSAVSLGEFVPYSRLPRNRD